MNITQHPAIEAYFAHESATDVDTLSTVFAHDAVVKDEGETIVGLDAIAAWRTAARKKYQYTVEPLDSQEDDQRSVVRVRLAGNFPGSPAGVNFTFRVRDAKVAALEIG